MKTIREICQSNFGDWKLIEALEAREKERDAAERDRIRAAVNGISFTEGHRKSILDAIYPPPEPEKLLAGYYEITYPNGKKTTMYFSDPIEPMLRLWFWRLQTRKRGRRQHQGEGLLCRVPCSLHEHSRQIEVGRFERLPGSLSSRRLGRRHSGDWKFPERRMVLPAQRIRITTNRNRNDSTE